MLLNRRKWSYKIPYDRKTYINIKRNTTFKRISTSKLVPIRWLIFKLNN